jgi:hypothetical protein
MGNLPAAPFGRPPGSSSDRAPSSCPSVTQGSPWICFAAWATRGVARTCLKRTRGFRRVTAGQSWLRGSVHVGVGPALSGQVNDRHPVPTLQCRSCFRVRVQGDTRDGGLVHVSGGVKRWHVDTGRHTAAPILLSESSAPVFGNQDAIAQRSSPGLASNRANR